MSHHGLVNSKPPGHSHTVIVTVLSALSTTHTPRIVAHNKEVSRRVQCSVKTITEKKPQNNSQTHQLLQVLIEWFASILLKIRNSIPTPPVMVAQLWWLRAGADSGQWSYCLCYKTTHDDGVTVSNKVGFILQSEKERTAHEAVFMLRFLLLPPSPKILHQLSTEILRLKCHQGNFHLDLLLAHGNKSQAVGRVFPAQWLNVVG